METNSKVVTECQSCFSSELESILFLGYLPPVNTMSRLGEVPKEEPSYPAQLLYCKVCHLVQLGLIVSPKILFPSEYPYTSSTTKVLRDNFSELYQECKNIISLTSQDLVIDIGSNDGNLLNNFKDHYRVLGITPEEIGKIAIERGIPTLISYFTKESVQKIKKENGQAKIITATNVFAHIDHIHEVVENIVELLSPEGVFISESHYFLSLLQTLQYDTIYHEHLRYYSLHSLNTLLNRHGLEIIHAKKISTHGGSIRVYASRKGQYPVRSSVSALMSEEKPFVLNKVELLKFGKRVALSKAALHALFVGLLKKGDRIYGVGAPSRASTLINYVGLDDAILECVVEIKGSHKIGKYVPGTLIPILEESKLYEEQPEYALLLSWHIADELAPKLREKGFRGKFIVPLPEPRILNV